ncbi:hypothetical protein KI688_012801 [Linnemannia hyalina]|uniref:Uncharacterized protein n=1 Tax=Linnemannia hyalina TaxID=64524 RepID=A0A9P7XT90_9FUNG|nr:hypothetical protein KI688_012801 [Linnemannia hyalina]
MTTTHDITIRSEAVGIGSTVSKINICPPDTLVCSKSRHYVCTLTKLHGPNGLFIMMYDRTWVDHDHHNDDCIGSSTPSTTYDLKEHPQAWKSRLDSPLPSHTPPNTLIEAHTPALDVADGSSLPSGCGHRVHNVDGVRKWHRIRAEMLRQAVNEWHKSLLLDQVLEHYEMSGSRRPTARLATPLSQSSKVTQHHYIQQDCCPSTPPIRHPNQSSEDGFWYVLMQIDWDAIWSQGLATGWDTIARAGEPLWKEDATLETNDVPADTPHQFSGDSHHNHLGASGTTTHFDKEDPAVDTFPSSAGIRIKLLQPKQTNPRLKFPTVYEIDSYSKDEEGGKLLNGDQGIPLSRHPSGQVKVIRSPISEHFLQEKDFVTRKSINDREEVMATLDNPSTAEVSSQVQEMSRYCSFYADLPEDSTPYQDTAVLQQASSSTTSLRPMTTLHTGLTTTTTPSASTPFASIRLRSPEIQPDSVIVHAHPSRGQDEHLCLGSNAVPVSRPKCRSLRTKQFPPSNPVSRSNERQPQDTNISEFLKLHQWARTPRHQQDQHITRKGHLSSHSPSATTTPQDDQVNNLATICLDGGSTLKRSSLRKLTSIKEEAALEKEPHQEQEQHMRRRNGKQFFEDARCIKPEKYTITDDLLDHQPQGELPPQAKGGRVAERWKPCLTTIPSEQVLETAESLSSPTSPLSPSTTATETTVLQASRRHLTHFADGHDPRVNSGSRASPIHMPTKISSATSTASGSTSPTRSSAGPTIPNRRPSGNSTLPSIASILKKPTRASCTTGNDSIDRKMSFPSMIRDPSKPQERSRLIEKGVKFVSDHAPHSVRLDKTIELIRLARLPLQDIASTATRAVSALPSPTSPIGSVFSQSTILTCPTTPTTPTSIRSPPHLSLTTAAEQDRSSQDYQHSHNTTTSDRHPTRTSYEDIMFLAGNATKTARDLILSPPQSTRIALMCTACNSDFQVTDQDSLRAFAGHVMQCDDKAKGRVGKVSKSLSSSMAVPSATFQRMRARIGERLLGRESVCDEGASVC